MTHSSVLEVIKKDVHALALLSEILHDNARAANNLARVTLTVDFAEPRPCAEGLRVRDLDEVGRLLGAERLDELEVFSLRDRLYENAEVGLPSVESLGTLAKTAREAVVDEGLLQDLLQIFKDS